MRVLIVGAGGREHALAWKLAKSPYCSQIFCAPGNGGISNIADCVDINASDIDGMVKFAKTNKIELTIVAPDDPLALGMVDALENEGLLAFGPKKNAAIIEYSKVFSKEFMKRHNIPTATFKAFSEFTKATEFLKEASYPIVIKVDGLALGKGVVIAYNFDEAHEALDNMMRKRLMGMAGEKIVIEEYLSGEEVSLLVFTDGKSIIPMIPAKDHKKVYNGNYGPNTGGMGAFAPSANFNKHIVDTLLDRIVEPTVSALANENRSFSGVLYFGLMLTENGPYVLEYNARFGDPEAQVIIPLLKNDLLEILISIVNCDLGSMNLKWENKSSVCVVLASRGYPGRFEKGFEILGLEELAIESDLLCFHAGTKKHDNRYFTNGGRVLGITAIADSITEASCKAYNAVGKVGFEGMHFRKDIGTAKN